MTARPRSATLGHASRHAGALAVCPDVIKVDVEGFELEVFNGIDGLMDTCSTTRKERAGRRPFLYFEAHPEWSSDVLQLVLGRLGFTFTQGRCALAPKVAHAT